MLFSWWVTMQDEYFGKHCWFLIDLFSLLMCYSTAADVYFPFLLVQSRSWCLFSFHSASGGYWLIVVTILQPCCFPVLPNVWIQILLKLWGRVCFTKFSYQVRTMNFKETSSKIFQRDLSHKVLCSENWHAWATVPPHLNWFAFLVQIHFFFIYANKMCRYTLWINLKGRKKRLIS